MFVVVPAPLDHIHGEVLVMFAFEELVASLDDSILLLVGEQAKAVVSDSGEAPVG